MLYNLQARKAILVFFKFTLLYYVVPPVLHHFCKNPPLPSAEFEFQQRLLPSHRMWRWSDSSPCRGIASSSLLPRRQASDHLLQQGGPEGDDPAEGDGGEGKQQVVVAQGLGAELGLVRVVGEADAVILKQLGPGKAGRGGGE